MPLPLPNAVAPTNLPVTTFATGKGINTRDFQQFLKDAFVDLLNTWKPGVGRFRKAPGSDLFVSITSAEDPTNGGSAIAYGIQATDDLWYLAYGTSLASYVPSTDTITVVKNNFTADVTWLELYGDWVYIASSKAGNKISYVDHVSAPSTVVEIADAPKADVLAILSGNRLAAGSTDSDSAEAHVARADQLSGVPFSVADDWTVGNDPDSPFKISNRRAGDVVGFGRLGNQTVMLHDKGKLGFRITSVDVSGTGLTLDTPIDWENLDFGATRGVKTTSKGIYYTNEFGVWQMTSGGLKDVPFSGVDEKISEPLDDEFLENYDFSDSDIEFDELRDLLLVTARDNATANNVVLVYHSKKGLEGWARWNKDVSRWIRDGSDIYYTSSLDTKVYKLNYNRGDDNGVPFETIFEIEPQLTSPGQLAKLAYMQLGVRADRGQVFDIELSIFDRKGVYKEAAQAFSLTTTNQDIGQVEGMTSGGMTATAMSVGRNPYEQLVFELFSKPVPTYEFTRLRCKITTNDANLSEINFVNLSTQARGVAKTGLPSS